MNLTAEISQDTKENIIGRIGGNIPKYFLNKVNEIGNYNFYLSFQNPQDKEKYISVFIPKNYNEMIDNNIYPNCSIKVFVHSFSEESNNEIYTIKGLNKANIKEYKKVESDVFNFITESKNPRLIQDENYYFKDLEKNGYGFFIQIDEDYYPENLIKENYVFGYGALYLYKHNITAEIIAGFWQYS